MGSFTEVGVVEVLVKPGDKVEVDTPLVTLETEKATMDVPSTAAGVVDAVHVIKGGKISAGGRVVTLSGVVVPAAAAPAARGACRSPEVWRARRGRTGPAPCALRRRHGSHARQVRAPAPRRVQYFEQMGHRGIWADGFGGEMGEIDGDDVGPGQAPVALDHELVISHGNGPQVGLLALQASAYDEDSTYPFDVLGAQTEGMIGYFIEQELGNLLPFEKPLATILTMTEVDPDDPAFADPTKFVGPTYTQAEARELANRLGWVVKPDGPDDTVWRRVVASPRPMRIFELRPIRWKASLILDRKGAFSLRSCRAKRLRLEPLSGTKPPSSSIRLGTKAA